MKTAVTTYLSLMATLAIPLASPLFAEHSCKADVSYQWKPKGEETPITVFYSRVQANGADDKAATEALNTAALSVKTEALGACRRAHENQASCVATKYYSYASTLASLSFTSRRKLEDAIIADCTGLQGLCTEPTLGEVTCSEVVAAAATGAEAPAKDAKAADKAPAKKK